MIRRLYPTSILPQPVNCKHRKYSQFKIANFDISFTLSRFEFRQCKDLFMLTPVRALLALPLFVLACAFSAEPTDATPVVEKELVNSSATPIRPSVNPQIDKGEIRWDTFSISPRPSSTGARPAAPISSRPRSTSPTNLRAMGCSLSATRKTISADFFRNFRSSFSKGSAKRRR